MASGPPLSGGRNSAEGAEPLEERLNAMRIVMPNVINCFIDTIYPLSSHLYRINTFGQSSFIVPIQSVTLMLLFFLHIYLCDGRRLSNIFER